MKRITPILILGLTLQALSGCARTVVENPQNTSYDPANINAQLDFWHNLDQRSAITNDEAMHAVLILAEGADPTSSYEERIENLKQRGWLQPSFDEPADLAVQRGTLARMLAFAIDAPQGVLSMVFNRTPRYALRDLMAIDIMPAGSDLQAIDGREFLGVLGKAQDYRTIQNARRQAAESPDQPADAG